MSKNKNSKNVRESRQRGIKAAREETKAITSGSSSASEHKHTS